MKQMRKLFLAVAMLAVSAVMMVTSSYAWFSMNQKVEATGFEVKATTSGSLVISDLASTLATADAAQDFVTTAVDLTPIYNNGINYVHAGSAVIDAATGAVKDGTLEALGEDTNAANGQYYVEEVVYLAAAGGALTGQDITMNIVFNDVSADNQKALTVEWRLYSNAQSTNVADSDLKVNDMLASKGGSGALNFSSTLTNIKVAENITIPEASTNVGVAIVIRVYFDGELKNGNTHYVNSQAGDIAQCGVTLTFNAKAYTAPATE